MIEVKATSYDYEVPVEGTESNSKYYPTVYISEVPAEAVKGLAAGSEVTVILRGKVKEVAMRDRAGSENQNNSLDLEINGIEINDKDDAKSDWEEMTEAD